MKAAVLHELGGVPRYEDFPDPAAGEGEVVIDVKAVAVENVDKMVAAGTHYAGDRFVAELPAIPGFDGAGTLPDGTLVGFGNTRAPYGALAEKTVVSSDAVGPMPEGIDAASAVALASAVPGMSIVYAAGFTAGEAVLIQGATGAKPTRVVQVGQSAGPTITLAAESLRTSGVEIYGAARGIDPTGIVNAYNQVVQWARDGVLTFDLETVPLSQIETAWQRTDLRGRRLVVVP